MSEQQLSLVAPEPAVLTERQQHALNALRTAGPKGITADEVGQHIHGWQGKHGHDELCRYCGSTGLELSRALRSKGYAKSRRDGHWYALQTEPKTYDLPEGF